MYTNPGKSEKVLFILAYGAAFIFSSVLLFIDIPSYSKALLLLVMMGLVFVTLYIYLFTGDQVHVQKAKDRISTGVIGLLHSTNGISSLKTYNDLIKMNLEANKDVRELVEQESIIINEYSDKVKSIVSDLSSSFRLDKENTDLIELVKQSCEFIKLRRIRDKKIPIELTSQDEAVYSEIFPNHLKSAVENIIENSYDELLEANNDDSHILIHVEKEKNMGVISIEDNGRGYKFLVGEIPGSKIKPGRTSKKNGNGLGLFVSVQAVELCGGSFTMFSNSKGLKTVLKFPLK